MKVRAALACAIATLVLPHLASGAIVASDGFESYTTGGAQFESDTGVGLNGGNGFSTAYNINDSYRSAVKVSSTGLNYSNGVVQRNGGTRSMSFVGTANADILAQRSFAPQNGTLYFSFLYHHTDSSGDTKPEDFVQIGLSDVNTVSEPKISVGTAGETADTGDNKFFLRSPAGNNTTFATSTKLESSRTYLMVVKLAKVGGTYRNVSFFLDPGTLTEPLTPTLSRNTETSISSVSTFTIRTARQDTSDMYYLDELRIGTSYADVIPEPASLGLVALAGMALLRRRHS